MEGCLPAVLVFFGEIVVQVGVVKGGMEAKVFAEIALLVFEARSKILRIIGNRSFQYRVECNEP